MSLSTKLIFLLVIIYAIFHMINCETNKFNAINDVVFRLFTRKNRLHFQKIAFNNYTTLLTSNFKPDKPLKIFIHGHTTISEAVIVVHAFLNSYDVNVITIDWTKGTHGTSEDATENVPAVGRVVAQFIDQLSTYNYSHDNVHIIGISLGCHVAGFAGRSTKKGKISYITACDPIGIHEWSNRTDVVNANDGKYVEIIHTNSGVYGIKRPLGTADFYPNGGVIMPGCENATDGGCSHAVSLNYFLDSIGNEYFVANKCKNYEEIFNGNCSNIGVSYMGGSYPKNISGIYYLTTNAHRPYYKVPVQVS